MTHKDDTECTYLFIHCGYEWKSTRSSEYCKHCGERLLGILVIEDSK